MDQMRSTKIPAAGANSGGDSQGSAALLDQIAGSVGDARLRRPAVKPGTNGEIASRGDNASPATIRESQSDCFVGDCFAGVCPWQGEWLDGSKHLTTHCALDTTVETASIARKSADTLMSLLLVYPAPASTLRRPPTLGRI